MRDVIFYEDERGKSPVYEYIEKLSKKTDKDSRVNFVKIRDYIKVLRENGKNAGMPFIKHIEGDIWELRPIRNRIFFASWADGDFILLHHFTKKTQATPLIEIKRAKRNLKDFRERRGIK